MSPKWIVPAIAALALPLASFASGQHAGHEGHAQPAPAAAPAPKAKPAKPFKGQVVELTVTEDGFVPDQVTVKKGVPVKLVITRKTQRTCATEIVIDEAKVNTALPLDQPVEVVFTPSKSGQLRYGCGMQKMVGGVLTIE